jgi:hypothetical protein
MIETVALAWMLCIGGVLNPCPNDYGTIWTVLKLLRVSGAPYASDPPHEMIKTTALAWMLCMGKVPDPCPLDDRALLYGGMEWSFELIDRTGPHPGADSGALCLSIIACEDNHEEPAPPIPNLRPAPTK